MLRPGDLLPRNDGFVIAEYNPFGCYYKAYFYGLLGEGRYYAAPDVQ